MRTHQRGRREPGGRHIVAGVTADLFDAAAMYDDDYLHFFASSEAGVPPPISSGGCWI